MIVFRFRYLFVGGLIFILSSSPKHILRRSWLKSICFSELEIRTLYLVVKTEVSGKFQRRLHPTLKCRLLRIIGSISIARWVDVEGFFLKLVFRTYATDLNDRHVLLRWRFIDKCSRLSLGRNNLRRRWLCLCLERFEIEVIDLLWLWVWSNLIYCSSFFILWAWRFQNGIDLLFLRWLRFFINRLIDLIFVLGIGFAVGNCLNFEFFFAIGVKDSWWWIFRYLLLLWLSVCILVLVLQVITFYVILRRLKCKLFRFFLLHFYLFLNRLLHKRWYWSWYFLLLIHLLLVALIILCGRQSSGWVGRTKLHGIIRGDLLRRLVNLPCIESKHRFSLAKLKVGLRYA